MKHNGIANLLLGFIYGNAFFYILFNIESLTGRLLILATFVIAIFTLTCALYGLLED